MLFSTEPSVRDVCHQVMELMWDGDCRDFCKNVGARWLSQVNLGQYDKEMVTSHVLIEVWHFLDSVGVGSVKEFTGFNAELQDSLFGE